MGILEWESRQKGFWGGKGWESESKEGWRIAFGRGSVVGIYVCTGDSFFSLGEDVNSFGR